MSSRTRALFLCWPFAVTALCAGAIKVVSLQPALMFSGAVSKTEVRFRNSGDTAFESEMFMRLFQLSSGTAMPVTEARRWKSVTVQPHQTIIEQVEIGVPGVRAETTFQLRWSDASGTALGATLISAFPTNLLSALKDLSGNQPLGVYDPELRLRPLLAPAKVEFADVEQIGFENFRGRLMFVFVNEPAKLTDELQSRVFKAVRRGVRTVLVLPKARDNSDDRLVILNNDRGGRCVSIHPDGVAGLNTNVASQLRLLWLARLVTATNLLHSQTPP